jgi:acetophenone carboxylase
MKTVSEADLKDLAQKRFGWGKSYGRDPECLMPELMVRNELEEKGMSALSDIDLSIFIHKLDSIVEEGRIIFIKLAMAESLMIGDLSTTILTSRGDIAAVSTGIPIHAVLNYGLTKYIMKYFKPDKTVGVRDGDVFLSNEAFAGLVHPWDVFVAMPIFFKDNLIAWAACGGHQGEMGSKDPGGFSPSAKNRYEEGLHVSPVKIGENFEVKRDILDWLANSVRNPTQFALDIKTRVAVCERMRRRLLQETEKRGELFVVAGLRRTIELSAEAARKRISELNDGVYRYMTFLDTIGTEDGLLKIPVALIKKDDQIVFDFTGISPEHLKGPYHAHWHLAVASVSIYLFSSIFEGIPSNIGLYEPFEFTLPIGSFYNTKNAETAIGMNSWAGRLVVQATHMAFTRMLFDSEYKEFTCAPFGSNLLMFFCGGIDQYGNPVAGLSSSLNAIGQGGRWDMDGEHTIGFFWASHVEALSAEEMEQKFPWLFISRNLFDKNMHGFGKFRGGVGMGEVFKIHNVSRMGVGVAGLGHIFTQNLGTFGGYAGPPNPSFLIRNSNIREMLKNTDENMPYGILEIALEKSIEGEYLLERGNSSATLEDDDVVFISESNSGGGGYGDVLERDPSMVMKDFKENLISEDVVRDIYFVAYDPVTLEADLGKTKGLRKEEKENRIKRGLPYEEFIRAWSEKKPPDEILQNYGPWPHPEALGY